MNALPERAAWLAGDVLLLAGTGANGAVEASATVAERPRDIATRTFALSRNGKGSERLLIASRFATPPADEADQVSLTLASGAEEVSVDPAQLAGSLTDPAAFLRAELGGLAPAQRARALRFLWAAAAPSLERTASFELARLLASLHEELRPALPKMVISPDNSNTAHVDVAFQVTPRALWVRGWMHDRDGTATRLTLVAPEGGRAELVPGMFRTVRNDLDKYYGDEHGVRGWRHGYIRYAELDGPSYVSNGWLIELETRDGEAVQKAAPDVVRDPIRAREAILLTLRYEPPGSDELMRDHVHPAVAAIQDGLEACAEIDTVVQLGVPPAAPSVSVIVPLYKELSFLEYQMAHWASDPHLQQQDLIYALDSPEQAARLDRLARGLHSMYGIPFRVAIMKGNAGFAGVNNCAAALARTGTLLLLNSDVVPDRPGWLERMKAFHDATPRIGALGPKLLYEDDSLQHAGMYFYRADQSRVWENMHYFKGQHRHFPAADVARQVPAVTGACLMVSRELYERVGGLSYRYVQGGYEDSDFCLRLLEEGAEQWYMPGAELYHLEDQSYPKDVRERATRYNMWLHTELWDERMERLMQQFPGLA